MNMYMNNQDMLASHLESVLRFWKKNKKNKKLCKKEERMFSHVFSETKFRKFLLCIIFCSNALLGYYKNSLQHIQEMLHERNPKKKKIHT